jgi:DNA-directed RNA polymerase subunit RPC12/RpoP
MSEEEGGKICHFVPCMSDTVYHCRDCREDFCLSCVPVEGKTVRQTIRCPRCSGDRVERRSPPPP